MVMVGVDEVEGGKSQTGPGVLYGNARFVCPLVLSECGRPKRQMDRIRLGPGRWTAAMHAAADYY